MTHTTIEDGPQTMCDKDARPCFLSQDAVDILQQSLLGTSIQCRGLRLSV